MNNRADIKRRLASVKQTRQITGAMEMISVSKMRKSFELFDENHVYFDTLTSVVAEIFARNDPEIAEYVKPRARGKKALIVISSDKGLCGGFNHDVEKLAEDAADADTVIIPIGRNAHDRFVVKARRGGSFAVDGRFAEFSKAVDYKYAKTIADDISARYGNEYSSVSLVYTRLISHAAWRPEVLKLLPMEETIDMREKDGDPRKAVAASTEFEPSASEVFIKLMPLYLGGVLYGAFVHSAAAEHSARRAAMSASAKNADEIADSLYMEYNRSRQNAVTEQITEMTGSRNPEC